MFQVTIYNGFHIGIQVGSAKIPITVLFMISSSKLDLKIQTRNRKMNEKYSLARIPIDTLFRVLFIYAALEWYTLMEKGALVQVQ
jgi:hypothetical protein